MTHVRAGAARPPRDLNTLAGVCRQCPLLYVAIKTAALLFGQVNYGGPMGGFGVVAPGLAFALNTLAAQATPWPASRSRSS